MPWAKRAMDSNTPTLNIDEQEATVRTMSSEHNGKEIFTGRWTQRFSKRY